MTDINRNSFRGPDSVVDLATISLKETLAALFRCWDAAIHDYSKDPEHVHQLRVATRRATAALELFAEFLPRRKTERLLRDLSTLRKCAGPARDCDVFLERLASLPGDLSENSLVKHVRELRSAAQQALTQHYEHNERGERLERQATNLIAELRPRGRTAKKVQTMSACDWVPAQLRSAVDEFFDECDVDTQCLEQLHEFRIRTKQFRYVLELLQSSLRPDRFDKAYSSVKKLTQRLGKVNDHFTADAAITGWLAEDFDPEFDRVLRRWRKDERRALRHAIDRFEDWWSSRRQRKLRRRLRDAAKIGNDLSVAD